LDVERAALISHPARVLSPHESAAFLALVNRRCKFEPIAYITGCKHFRSIELRVDRRVLIPRPETEGIVEAALDLPRGVSVVDVGTGSGAIALALKTERPDLRIIATDVSVDALDVARGNAERLGLEIEFRAGNLLEPITEPIDAVVANPPYVAVGDALPLDVSEYEPREALFAGANGLDIYRQLIPQIGHSAAEFVTLEVGETQAKSVLSLLVAAGFKEGAVRQDLAGRDRVVIGRR
jgi:release factor glutamine methyltransferase